MKVTQERLSGSQIGLEIEIPAETSKEAYEKVVKELARSANIPGFRKGKVPRPILLQRIGPKRIKAAALEDLIQDSIEKAIEQESIEALGNYKLQSSFDELTEQYQPGQPLTFSASVDVPPQVQLGDYQNLSVKAEEVKNDPQQQVEETLEQYRQEQATLVPVEDRPAQLGDITVVDYEGRLPGEPGEDPQPLPGVQATDFELELEPERFVEGIVQGIVGMHPGETKEISVVFPEDYPREDLAGKTTLFTITLKEIKEKELPELDDGFAQEASEFETLAEWRESLTQEFQKEAERQTESNVENALLEALLAQAEIDLPQTLIEQEVQTMLTQTAIQMSNYGLDVRQMFTKEMVAQMKERSRPEAINRLKQSLALQEVAKRESLEPTPEEIETKSAEVKAQLGEESYDPDRLREVVIDDLRKEKALAWLKEHATIELVPQGSLTPEQPETSQPEPAAAAQSEAANATVEVAVEETANE